MLIDKLENLCLNILRKIKLGKLADIYEEHKEGMRYLVFGALSTVVNIVVFALASKIGQCSTTVSNVIAWIAAVIFAYITNKLWVFASETKNAKELFKEIISFFSARVVTLVLETIFLNICIDRLGFNDILMKIISNILVILLNFIFSKLFIFKKGENGE